MARFTYIDTNPRFLAVDLAKQLLPGTFEHALNHLLDGAIDLSHFDARFWNNVTGAPGPRDVHRAVWRYGAAFHDDCAVCQHARRRHRESVCGGAGGV